MDDIYFIGLFVIIFIKFSISRIKLVCGNTALGMREMKVLCELIAASVELWVGCANFACNILFFYSILHVLIYTIQKYNK